MAAKIVAIALVAAMAVALLQPLIVMVYAIWISNTRRQETNHDVRKPNPK